MRYKSSKRRKHDQKHLDDRKSFLADCPNCWVCGAPSTEVHEIARGGARKEAFGTRSAWMSTCNYCNFHALDNYENWPIERQLALKALEDPEHYDRVTVNRLRGRADGAITEAEVIAEAFDLAQEML